MVDKLEAGERWQHVKRGTSYEVLGLGELQMQSDLVDGSSLVIYRGDDGRLWAREEGEFLDGRFVKVSTPIEDARERVKVLEEALERCALIVERNLGRQDEKVYDVPLIARTALGNKETDRHG